MSTSRHPIGNDVSVSNSDFGSHPALTLVGDQNPALYPEAHVSAQIFVPWMRLREAPRVEPGEKGAENNVRGLLIQASAGNLRRHGERRRLALAEDEIILEGEGSSDEMQARVQALLAERGWTGHAHVGFAFEPPPEGKVGFYRVMITPPPDDEPIVKTY